MDLAVDVGLSHMVQVHQGQLADTTAGQGLGRPGTDPAHTHDNDMSITDALSPAHSVQPLQTAESALGDLVRQLRDFGGI
jgi:hypothetical protein